MYTAKTSSRAARNAERVIRWTEEDGDRFAAEDGRARLEVFPAPFKPGLFCWRHLRMSTGLFWKPKNGGIAPTIEAAMDAAALSLVAS